MLTIARDYEHRRRVSFGAEASSSAAVERPPERLMSACVITEKNPMDQVMRERWLAKLARLKIDRTYR
jgi:hypothetical protein